MEGINQPNWWFCPGHVDISATDVLGWCASCKFLGMAKNREVAVSDLTVAFRFFAQHLYYHRGDMERYSDGFGTVAGNGNYTKYSR